MRDASAAPCQLSPLSRRVHSWLPAMSWPCRASAALSASASNSGRRSSPRAASARPSPGLSLVSGSSVPPQGSHWSAAALSLPRRLIAQRQLRRLPLAEPPCAGVAVGSRQLQARLSLAKRRSRQPGPPRRKARRQPELSGQHRAGSRGRTGASAEDSSAGGVRENGSEGDRKSTRLNSSHTAESRMPSSA